MFFIIIHFYYIRKNYNTDMLILLLFILLLSLLVHFMAINYMLPWQLDYSAWITPIVSIRHRFHNL